MYNESGPPKRDLPERTFEFARRIVLLCQEMEGTGETGKQLVGQLLRVGTSLGVIIDEAHAGPSRPDFMHKLSLACKEARETQYWLRLAAATLAPASEYFPELQDEARQLVAILTTIVKNSKQ